MRVTIKNFKLAGPAAGTLRATADVQLTHSNGKKLLTIREAKVIEGKEGLFVSLPSIKRGERYLHLIVPCTRQPERCRSDVVLCSQMCGGTTPKAGRL